MAKQFYDISNKLSRQMPVIKFEEGKEFKINSSLKGAIAIQGIAESGKEDLNTLRQIVSIGIGVEGLEYVESQDFTIPDWQTIVETISNAMMGLDDEEGSLRKKVRWYDLVEDWDLIEASFVTQYGIRLRETDMQWDEFCTLLSGIMPKTPLGQVVSIRSEEDKETLKTFNDHQRKIRQDWRSKQARLRTEEENELMMKKLEHMFEKAFG